MKSATGIHTLHHTDCSQDCGLRVMVRAAVSTTCFRRPPRHESRLCGTRIRLLRRLHEHGIDRYGLRSWIFVSGEARFVSRGLPRTAGWNDAAAFDEGRWVWKSNGSRIACNSTFKSKRRRDIPAARPLGKQPRFVVARSANPICRHILKSICGIAAMLTNRVFAHKSPGTPLTNRQLVQKLHRFRKRVEEP